MSTGQSPSTSPSPRSRLGPGCLCSCSTSSRAQPQGQPQAQTSLASWFTTGISHNRPAVSTPQTRWTLLLLFHIHIISLSGSDEQKYMQQMSEEERGEKMHLSGLSPIWPFRQVRWQKSNPPKSCSYKTQLNLKDRLLSLVFFHESFQKPQISKSTLPEGYVMHPLPADKRTWTCSRSWFMTAGSRRWRQCHLPPYPCPPREVTEFKGMDVQPLLVVSCQSSALRLLWLMLIHHLESVLAVCSVFHGE